MDHLVPQPNPPKAMAKRRKDTLPKEIQASCPRYWLLTYSSLYLTGTPEEMKVGLCEVPPLCRSENVYDPTHNWVIRMEGHSAMRPNQCVFKSRLMLLKGSARLSLLRKKEAGPLTVQLKLGDGHSIDKNDVYYLENTTTSLTYVWLIGSINN